MSNVAGNPRASGNECRRNQMGHQLVTQRPNSFGRLDSRLRTLEWLLNCQRAMLAQVNTVPAPRICYRRPRHCQLQKPGKKMTHVAFAPPVRRPGKPARPGPPGIPPVGTSRNSFVNNMLSTRPNGAAAGDPVVGGVVPPASQAWRRHQELPERWPNMRRGLDHRQARSGPLPCPPTRCPSPQTASQAANARPWRCGRSRDLARQVDGLRYSTKLTATAGLAILSRWYLRARSHGVTGLKA